MTMPSWINLFTAANADNNNITTVDGTVTITAGEPLIVAVTLFDTELTETISSVQLDPAGNNEALTFEVAATNDDESRRKRVEIWYITNPTAGSNLTIRATSTAAVHGLTIAGGQAQDADTTDPIGATATATFTLSTNASIDVTTTAANSLVLGAVCMGGNDTATPGTGDTEQWDFVADGAGGRDNLAWGADTPASTTGTYTVSVDNDGGLSEEWAIVGIEILEAAAADERVPKMIGPIKNSTPIRQLRI